MGKKYKVKERKTQSKAVICGRCGKYGILYYTGKKGRFDCYNCGYRVMGPSVAEGIGFSVIKIYPFCSIKEHPIIYGKYKTKKNKEGWYFRCPLCKRTVFTWKKDLAERWIAIIEKARKGNK